MRRAARSESEPWTNWLSGGPVVAAALWGRHVGHTSPATHAFFPLLPALAEAGKVHGVWVAGQVGESDARVLSKL